MAFTGRKQSTISTYQSHINDLTGWMKRKRGRRINILNLDESDAQAYADYLRENLKPRSYNDEVSALRAFYNFLIAEGHAHNNPFESIPRLELPDDSPRILTKTESFVLDRTLVQAKNRRNACIVLTLKLAGLRTSEVIELKPDDVIITQGKGFLVIRGTAFRRTVPMPKALIRELGSYVKERSLSEWLFPSSDEEPLTARGVQHLIMLLGSKLNIKGLTAQAIRNTYTKNLLNLGIHPDEVARLIGVARVNPRLLPGTDGGGERP